MGESNVREVWFKKKNAIGQIKNRTSHALSSLLVVKIHD